MTETTTIREVISPAMATIASTITTTATTTTITSSTANRMNQAASATVTVTLVLVIPDERDSFLTPIVEHPQIRSLFEEHGNIVEVVLLKDKRTGQQQESCFVKYAKLEEADHAIGALHNQYTFPGGVVPIKVRYAEGERELLGGLRELGYKLYVGCLNEQASKREVEEIFSPYGLVEDVYIVCDELKQNRGCGFIQFSHRDMAVAAINALNGTYVMRGCDQPLVVRFADPKKPRTGESRYNSRFGGPGFGPRYQELVVRPAPYLSDPIAGHMLTNALHPPSPKSVASSSQGGFFGVIGPASGTLLGHGLPSSAHQVSLDINISPTAGTSCMEHDHVQVQAATSPVIAPACV